MNAVFIYHPRAGGEPQVSHLDSHIRGNDKFVFETIGAKSGDKKTAEFSRASHPKSAREPDQSHKSVRPRPGGENGGEHFFWRLHLGV